MPNKKPVSFVRPKPIPVNTHKKHLPLIWDIPADNVKAHKLSMNGVFVSGMKKHKKKRPAYNRSVYDVNYKNPEKKKEAKKD